MQDQAENSRTELEKLEPLLQQSLRSGLRILRFPPELERMYRLFVHPGRRRRYITLALVALVLYDLFAICDWFILPDIFHLAVMVRFLVVTPAILLGMWLIHRRGNGRMLDPAAAILLLLGMASLCLFMGLSRHPNVIHYYSGISVILMFSNMILRQPFAYALGVSLGGCLLYLLTLPHIPSMPSDSAISSVMVIVTSALFSLIGNFQTNYEHRRDFLMNALQQISGRKLSRMNSQLERLSLTDGLTGLANRRQFDLTLQREWHAAQRNRYPLTLVFLDVDHFKNYNDNYGHPAGDIVLRRIGAVLTMVSKRAQDLPARYGGEEFVVLLPHTDPEHGRMLAEGIRQDVQALGIPHDYSEAADVVTVSLGVASFFPDRQHHPEDLVSQADQALYEAKQSGRNRVVVATRER